MIDRKNQTAEQVTKMSREQSSRIRVIGFLMAFEVVMYHAGNGGIPRINDFDARVYTSLSGLFNFILAQLAMCWYYTVTAFLLFYHFTPKNYIPKMKRRFVTLLLPYVLWQVICIPFAPPAGWKSFVKTVFFLRQWPPNAPLWYIYAIFLLAFLTPLLWILLRGRKTGVIAAFVLAVGAHILLKSESEALANNPSFANFINILTYMPAYFFGAYFGLHADDGEHEQLQYALLILIAALLLNPFLDDLFFTFARQLLPVLMLYLCPVSERFAASPLTGLTFLFYTMHSLFVGNIADAVRGLMMKITPYAWVTSLVGRLATIPAVILAAWVAWRILSAVSPKLLGILTGGRVKPYAAKG